MTRPLFKKSIVELEELFRKSRNSPERLRLLAEELTHRHQPRAVSLREEVSKDIEQSSGASPESASVDQTPSAEEKGGSRQGQRKSRTLPRRDTISDSSASQEFVPPDEFTLIQPMGVRPGPSAFRPALKNDLHLPVSSGDSRPRVYCVALAELICEMKRRRVGFQQFVMQDGQRVATEAGNCSYQFEFGEEANIFEGAKVELLIGGRVVSGQLTGILQGCIVITLQEDFGEEIKTCTLRIDNTALLQALHDRLQKIDEGQEPSFRSKFAESVLKNEGRQQSGVPIVEWPWLQSPTTSQSTPPCRIAPTAEHLRIPFVNKTRTSSGNIDSWGVRWLNSGTLRLSRTCNRHGRQGA